MNLTLTSDGAQPIHIKVQETADEASTVLEELVVTPQVSTAQARALRVESGGTWTVPMLVSAIGAGIGPDELTALVFLGRRQKAKAAGTDPTAVTFAQAEDDVDAWSDESATIRIRFGDDEVLEDDSPEG